MFDIIYSEDRVILRVKDRFKLISTGVFDGDEEYIEVKENTIRVVKENRDYTIEIGTPYREELQKIVLSAIAESGRK